MIDYDRLPCHIGIIMDGNGRWAQSRNLPRTAGHREGLNAAKDVVRAASEIGVSYVTLYTFSTENWKRTREEVSFLMKLIETHLTPQEIHRAGWLDSQGIENVLQQYRDTDTSPATRRGLDAVINHMLGVQLLHQHFIDTDVPKLARERAEALGWT